MSPRSRAFPRRLRWAALAAALAAGPALAGGTLRVCADPDNLPYSNLGQEGYENKIAQVLAQDLHARVAYTWLKQRQSFFRQTLGADRCDVVISVPGGFERVRTTRPYYRSGYVVVSQRQRRLDFQSYDDPVLRGLKIGLHTVGNDGSNSPPAVALGRHGLANNIFGFSLWGGASVKQPQGQIIEAVARGRIDMAIVWGPFGGYYAARYGDALAVRPAPNDAGMPGMPFAYDIAMGVRKDDQALAARLDAAIERRRDDIQRILSAYHLPLIEPDLGPPGSPADAAPAHPSNHEGK